MQQKNWISLIFSLVTCWKKCLILMANQKHEESKKKIVTEVNIYINKLKKKRTEKRITSVNLINHGG